MSKRSTMQGFQRNFGRKPAKVHSFAQPVQQHQQALDPGALYHYWYPRREGVEACPPEFAAKLLEVGGMHPDGTPNLACVRPPAGAPIRCRCWLVFYHKPEVTHHLSPGWLLVTAWHNGAEPTPQPLPLDNRLLANLTLQSLKGGRDVFGRDFDNARQYFDRVVSQMRHDKEQYEKGRQAHQDDRAKDYWDATKIKNIGHGSKFALHHDGTVFPSRGEQNWLAERGRYLPADVLARDEAETAKLPRTGRTSARVDQDAAYNFQFQKQLQEQRVRQQIRELVLARRRSTTAGR